jgi:hypothetical protein
MYVISKILCIMIYFTLKQTTHLHWKLMHININLAFSATMEF